MDHCHLSNITQNCKNKTLIQPQKLDWISFVLTGEILPKREIKELKFYLKVILEVSVARSGEKKRKRKIARFLYFVLIV
jgi:hypothetical protein